MAEPSHAAGQFAEATSPPRARLRLAVMELVVERGYENFELAEVLERAGMDRADFDPQFDGLDDLCLRVYLANIEEFDRVVFGADDEDLAWRERVRSVAYAAARYVRDRPQETGFDMIAMLQAGDAALAHRDRYVRRIVDLIDAGRCELDDPDSVGRGVAESALGSVYEALAREMSKPDGSGSAEAAVPSLMYIAVRPYLGQEAALEELQIPPPPEART